MQITEPILILKAIYTNWQIKSRETISEPQSATHIFDHLGGLLLGGGGSGCSS